MTKKAKGDDPVYPRQHTQAGISIRDYFAAAALTGLLIDWKDGDVDAATHAYLLADAMISARAKK